jgi:hypothetical protein
MSINGTGNVQRDLNHSMPAAFQAKLGDVLNDLITQHNNLLAALTAANIAGLVLTSVTAVTPLSQR